MNKQRKVVITTTYNEMGIIIDTKVKEVPQPNLQPTCNQLATDTISRQAAIDAVNELTKWYLETYHETRPTTVAVIDRLTELPSTQPEQRWIPSGEKPPEEGSYLVWMPFAPPKHRMTVAKYCGGYWNIKTPISAWMPLPEPYKEESEKDG